MKRKKNKVGRETLGGFFFPSSTSRIPFLALLSLLLRAAVVVVVAYTLYTHIHTYSGIQNDYYRYHYYYYFYYMLNYNFYIRVGASYALFGK